MVRIGPAFTPAAGTVVAPTKTPESASAAAAEAPGVGFHNGQVLSVELIKAVGSDEGLFRIAGKYFRALYPTGLTPGVAVPMRVMDTGPPLVLRLPDFVTEVLSRLVHPSQTSYPAAFASLEKAFAESAANPEQAALASKLREILTLPEEPKELAKALERFLSKSGVFHEAFLARGEEPGDVKALALKLLSMLGEGDKALPALKAIVSHVETFQARSLVADNPVVPFFLNWGGEEIKGEFELKDGEAGPEGRKAGGLVIRLDMPNLGHVESSLWWHSGALSVTFRVPKAVEGWLAERLGGLEEKLKVLPDISLAALRVEEREPAKPASGRSLFEVTA